MSLRFNFYLNEDGTTPKLLSSLSRIFLSQGLGWLKSMGKEWGLKALSGIFIGINCIEYTLFSKTREMRKKKRKWKKDKQVITKEHKIYVVHR